jgi:hypothetical protein
MRYVHCRVLALPTLLLMALSWAAPAFAEEQRACDRFDWPLAVERTWFDAVDLPSVETGARLGSLPMRGVALKLQPAAQVHLEVPPSRAPKVENPRSGIASFDILEAGLYQVTISDDGWVDVVQKGAAVQAVTHTGNRDCAGLRKSVRFNLVPGATAIQISGASSDTIRIAIRKLD